MIKMTHDDLKYLSQLNYTSQLQTLRDIKNYTWDDIKNILNTVYDTEYSSDKYRKDYYKISENTVSDSEDSIEEELSELDLVKLERVKLSDERTQINALYRRISREESIKEIAHDVAAQMNERFLLTSKPNVSGKNKNEAILEISDWHYGIEISNSWNKFNPEIAVDRINQLKTEVISKCKLYNVGTLHVVNLGDLIAGRIHLPLRINSRFDVITQIMQISEILAEFLDELAKDFEIHYYDTLDNHSRLEPNLKASLELESLTRITSWFLKERVPNIHIHTNALADDIITFECLGHRIAGVHGNHDKPITVVDNLTMMAKEHFDLILTAHLHHFSGDEKNETIVVSNGSLMGTDEYAVKLRLSATPSQNLIIVNDKNPTEAICRIILK